MHDVVSSHYVVDRNRSISKARIGVDMSMNMFATSFFQVLVEGRCPLHGSSQVKVIARTKEPFMDPTLRWFARLYIPHFVEPCLPSLFSLLYRRRSQRPVVSSSLRVRLSGERAAVIVQGIRKYYSSATKALLSCSAMKIKTMVRYAS